MLFRSDQSEQLKKWQASMPNNIDWQLDDEAHFGGFAKCPPVLTELIERYQQQGLPLDPVYTAKLVAAYEKNTSLNSAKVLLIHTGGLQGRRGLTQAF